MKRSIGLLLLIGAASLGATSITTLTLLSGATPGESVLQNNGLNNGGNTASSTFTPGTIVNLTDLGGVNYDDANWANPSIYAPGASWISFENTGEYFPPSGPGQTVIEVPNAGCSANSTPGVGNCQPNAEFFQTFTDYSSDLSLTLTVWADDTAAVYLDGILILDPSFTQNSNGPCASPNNGETVTCSGSGTTITLSYLTFPELASGVPQTLEFDVYQTGGATYGLMYDGTVTGLDLDPVSSPEPASFVLLGTGLAAFALLRGKRVF